MHSCFNVNDSYFIGRQNNDEAIYKKNEHYQGLNEHLVQLPACPACWADATTGILTFFRAFASISACVWHHSSYLNKEFVTMQI